MPRRTLHLDRPLDLVRTVSPHLRGRGDPAMRIGPRLVVRATRTPDGPATFEVHHLGDRLDVEAWGPGAAWALEAAPAFVGIDDDRSGFAPARPPDRRPRPPQPGVADRAERGRARGADPGDPRAEGHRHRGAARVPRHHRHGGASRRPGPHGLRLLPEPAALAAIPYHAFHPIGLERRRADLVRAVAARAARFEEIVAMPLPDAYARLRAMPGIGPWTAAEVAIRALGDPDAVSVGDYHLPSLVAWALAGERKATDERMLELLEPFRGHRGRVIRLLESSGIRPEARGPRMQPRSIAAI